MARKKYTLYVLDKDNRFLKDCFFEYFENVRSFEDHFTPDQMAKIKKFRNKRKALEKKSQTPKRKSHKYTKTDITSE